MAQGSTARLLAAVWGTRKGYVFLPFKDLSRSWNETGGLLYDGSKLPSLSLPRGDIYFCPVVFSEPHRKKEYALTTNVLWADLDPVNPENCRLRPSIAWESSPGRYQALWFLSTEVTAEEASKLSKRIAYAEGADKGGWDVTQVLRLPGTRNYKYETTPQVKLLWAERFAYSVSEILAAYPPVNGDATKLDRQWPQLDEALVQSAIQSLPYGLRKRLTASTAGADRSLELQKLTRDLIRHGVDSEVVLHIIQRSSWNKFAGRSDEIPQLLKQVESALTAVETRKVAPKAREPIDEMVVRRWGDFLSIPTQLTWLVDDAWVDRTVGFISGRSKSYKTWIALDLALSVVSGEDFLGRYPVRRTGPVLLIQEEDPTAILQDRLRLIGKAKGMMPTAAWDEATQTLHLEFPDWPLHIINLQGFNLGVEEKIAQVRHLIAELSPVMVILDPLIVMLPKEADEFKAGDIAQVLQSVKMWREEFKCSVVIVHHWNKTKVEDTGDRGGQHMYGSFAFHAWLESALHVLPVIEEDTEHIDSVIVEREFKAAPSSRAMRLKFEIDSIKEYTYSVKFEDKDTISPRQQTILDVLGQQGGGCSTSELVAMTGIPRTRFVEEIGKLVQIKLVRADKGGGRGNQTRYWLPDQSSSPS